MDDFSLSNLGESKNEWCARLLNILTTPVNQGVKSIFEEAWKLCADNKELDKYLMTFQNFLTRVPKWNSAIIETEKNRIIETSGCTYLEELVTCVHIVQMKILTCVRVGSKQKKLDINVPSINDFIHKIYIHVARKIYMNIYLFDKNIAPLQIQENNSKVEHIIKECILNAVRDSIPVESILRAYIDETDEQHVEVNEVVETLPEPVASAPVPPPAAASTATPAASTATPAASTATPAEDEEEHKKTTDFSKISFSNNDLVRDEIGNTTLIDSPKDEQTLDEKEEIRAAAAAAADNDDEDTERLKIGDNVELDIIEINDLNSKSTSDNLKIEPITLDFIDLT